MLIDLAVIARSSCVGQAPAATNYISTPFTGRPDGILLDSSRNVVHHSRIHTLIQTLIHTPTAVSATQGDSQLVRSSQGEVSCSGGAMD